MLSRKLLLIIAFPLFAFTGNPYDTSTPQKYVESMGLISSQPKTDNPLPYFYEKEAAQSIFEFDNMAGGTLEAFDTFRSLVVAKFPNHVKTNREGKIRIALDGYAGKKLRSFDFSASTIGPVLKERKPSDYEFISATELDSNMVSQLTVKILGKKKTIPLTKTTKGYRMFLPEQVLEKFSKIVVSLGKLNQVFRQANELLENNTITKENFEIKMDEISIKYEEAME